MKRLDAFLKRFNRGWKCIQSADPRRGRMALAGISSSSERLEPGFVFLALHGAKTHGAHFIPQALKAGCPLILIEPPCPAAVLSAGKNQAVLYLVPQLRRRMGEMASWIYGDPSMKLPVVAVTGTNGKTTACFMLESIASEAGKKSGVLGTVSCRVAGREFPAKLTTPEADEFFSYLARMRAAGCAYAFIEATSQALALGRLEGFKPKGAVFTNLTRDHLDFHKTMARYFAAKKILFERLLAGSKWSGRFAAVNAQDPWGKRLLKNLSARQPGLRRFSYALEAGHFDFSAAQIRQSFEGVSFRMKTAQGETDIRLHLFGRHNVANALAAAAAAHGLGFKTAQIARGLQALRAVPGRLEKVPGRPEVLVLVDYAHTDDALRHVLAACREIPQIKRLIVVFGCGGDRDPGKRPLMGRVAAQWADFTVITSDNPRGEEPSAIVDQIEQGMRTAGCSNYVKIVDRREAIFWALRNARAGDCVLIAGKGHETYQILGTRTIHFDDRETAREALQSAK